MRNIFLGIVITMLAAGLSSAADVRTEKTIRVAYAGSMGVVMDRFLGPAFAATHDADYQGIGQGAYGLARLLASKQLQADVFISITPGPLKILQEAGMMDEAVPIASTQMVIIYNSKSRFLNEFEAARAGKTPWWQALETAGLRFGRTDPATDPQGQNIIFTILLAQRYYHQPDLVRKILGSYRNPAQIFTEPSLLSRLEAGQLDASSGYRSAAISHHMAYIKLPAEINLGNPSMAAGWYGKARFSITSSAGKEMDLKPQPLVFYATVLKDARNPVLGKEFIRFLRSPEGRKMLRENGYGNPEGADIIR